MTVENIHFDNMLKAKQVRELSNCRRRKIGVLIPIEMNREDPTSSIGFNSVLSTAQCCQREKGICPAIHAEVKAVKNLGRYSPDVTQLFIWAEVPCHNCLEFIRRYSSVKTIYCLTAESYAVEYPRVLDRTDEITQRLLYAQAIGLDVVRLDAKEIEEYELSRNQSLPQ